MYARRILPLAVKEAQAGNFKGPNMTRLMKILILAGIALPIQYQIAKAGYRQASAAVRSIAQMVDNIIETLTMKWVVQSITDNPTLSMFKDTVHTIQDFSHFLLPWVVDEPRDLEFNEAIQDTYIAPVETAKDVVDIFTN